MTAARAAGDKPGMTAARAAGDKPGMSAAEVEWSGLTARRPEFGVTPR